SLRGLLLLTRVTGVPGAAVAVVPGALSRVSGEGDEDVVEGGTAQADVVDLDAPGVELADHLGEQLGAAGDRDGQLAHVLLDGGLPLAEAAQDLGGGREVFALVHHDLDALAAGAGLELIGGALG